MLILGAKWTLMMTILEKLCVGMLAESTTSQ